MIGSEIRVSEGTDTETSTGSTGFEEEEKEVIERF